MSNLDNILFFDIETVPGHSDFSELSEEGQELFVKKNQRFYTEELTDEEMYAQRAGILSEFGQIVCISIGVIHTLSEKKNIRVKSFYGEDEKMLLQEFVLFLHDQPQYSILCGHNVKEFDIPYVARRCIIHGISLPTQLQLWGKKPWEIAHLDTMDMWKFGDYKHFTSLKLLCHVLGVPSPKDDIDGSQVANVFYIEKDVKRIATYCEKDVVATIQVFLRLREYEPVDPKFIHTGL